MTISLKKSLFFFFSTLVISFHSFAQKQPETIPEFTFFKFDKTPFTNKNLEPNKLIFICFFDVSCDHCQRAIGKISDHYKEFGKAAVYLVTLDQKESVKNFLNKYGKNIPGKKHITILHDLQNQFIIKFRPVKYPSMFLYGKNKKLIRYDDHEENVSQFIKDINHAAKWWWWVLNEWWIMKDKCLSTHS